MKNKETLEEAAENKYIPGVYVINGIDICEASRECFIEGAKWQEKQDKKMYSEEDLEVAYFEGREGLYSFNDWIKQFKKK